MNARQVGGHLVRLLEIIADLCIISALWLICCLPIVTFGAASAALYGAVTKVVRNERGTLTRTFFAQFRECFKQGVFLSLIFAGCCALIFIYVFMGSTIPLSAEYSIIYWVIVLILTVILAGTFIYAFPLLAGFRQSTWSLLRTGFFLSAGYPFRTLALILSAAFAVALVLKFPLLILILPGIFALVASIIQQPVFEKHTAKMEKDRHSSDSNR